MFVDKGGREYRRNCVWLFTLKFGAGFPILAWHAGMSGSSRIFMTLFFTQLTFALSLSAKVMMLTHCGLSADWLAAFYFFPKTTHNLSHAVIAAH